MVGIVLFGDSSKQSSIMRFTWFILGLSIAGSTIASHKHIMRRDDDAAPTEADIKTAEAPKRFIVEFAEVSLLHFQTQTDQH